MHLLCVSVVNNVGLSRFQIACCLPKRGKVTSVIVIVGGVVVIAVAILIAVALSQSNKNRRD
jgi:uncharacterized membrane protein